ncbi:RNA polymerase sigma factor SigM [Gimesia alba]|uniref:RNA polymerase sigma factor SigM n=1 Tax=Gimesia alba TaxID=2527973 RepID=A0A517RLV8_9PLAN|nr:sigma-70 family RNA polymerase sigma factor [Gimesia alba]QDT44859.1 RNA polymerase sigma factor SigM [Gimesia alba]
MSEHLNNPVMSEEFFRLFSRDDRKIYGYIMALVLDVAAAEDIFQETCVILWKEFPEYDHDRSFLNWAYGIAFNQVRKYRRKYQNKRLIFSDSLVTELAKDVSSMMEEQSQRQLALTQCLKKLSARERELVDAYYGEQQTAATVAERWKCSSHAIYKTIKKIRKALFDCVNRRLSSEVSS